jgi:hypothetical protein
MAKHGKKTGSQRTGKTTGRQTTARRGTSQSSKDRAASQRARSFSGGTAKERVHSTPTTRKPARPRIMVHRGPGDVGKAKGEIGPKGGRVPMRP